MTTYPIHIPRDILVLLILATALSLLRILFFQNSSLIYLLWNIFLALVPFFLSSLLQHYAEEHTLTKLTYVTLGILWILLIPNAPYIVTDLIHLMHTKGIPIIYDTFLLFTSAWIGLLLFFYSFSHIEHIIKIKYSQKTTSILLVLLTILISFGMYLGRFLRFNSWDIFANPTSIYGGVSQTLSSTHTSEALIFIVLSSVFIYVSYCAWKYGSIK
jgi:uncharacterized membrane protein